MKFSIEFSVNLLIDDSANHFRSVVRSFLSHSVLVLVSSLGNLVITAKNIVITKYSFNLAPAALK